MRDGMRAGGVAPERGASDDMTVTRVENVPSIGALLGRHRRPNMPAVPTDPARAALTVAAAPRTMGRHPDRSPSSIDRGYARLLREHGVMEVGGDPVLGPPVRWERKPRELRQRLIDDDQRGW